MFMHIYGSVGILASYDNIMNIVYDECMECFLRVVNCMVSWVRNFEIIL